MIPFQTINAAKNVKYTVLVRKSNENPSFEKQPLGLSKKVEPTYVQKGVWTGEHLEYLPNSWPGTSEHSQSPFASRSMSDRGGIQGTEGGGGLCTLNPMYPGGGGGGIISISWH